MRAITLASEASRIVSFTVEGAKAGKHKVEVGGLSGSFTVVVPSPLPPLPSPAPPAPPPQPSTNWPLIGGIVGGVVIAELFGFFWLRRRAYLVRWR